MGDFSSYLFLSSTSGKIEAKSPIRIGAGKAYGILTSDLPVVKNSKGIPIIPGSSLKGFFRGQMEKILLMKVSEKKRVDKILTEIFGGSNENDNASAILFHEIQMVEGRLSERKHIAINPETGGVRYLFDVECVLDGAVFAGKMFSTRNLHPRALALVKPVIDLANLGLGRIGGFKSRGYGEVEIKIENISLIFPGKGLEELSRGFEIRDLIPENFGSLSVKGSDSEILIDGIKIKAEIVENNSFFGIEAKIKGEEADKFLASMLRKVNL